MKSYLIWAEFDGAQRLVRIHHQREPSPRHYTEVEMDGGSIECFHLDKRSYNQLPKPANFTNELNDTLKTMWALLDKGNLDEAELRFFTKHLPTIKEYYRKQFEFWNSKPNLS